MHRETSLAGSHTGQDSWAVTGTGGLAGCVPNWPGPKLVGPVVSRPAGNKCARERAASPAGLRTEQSRSVEVAPPLLLFCSVDFHAMFQIYFCDHIFIRNITYKSSHAFRAFFYRRQVCFSYISFLFGIKVSSFLMKVNSTLARLVRHDTKLGLKL
jgi:hypothetical protein